MRSAVVIGSGFGGIGAAVALQRAGVRDVTILERGDDLGGVWRDNTYPGAACDVPSHLYSFSFARRPDWSAMFPGQPEILDYLREVAADHGLTERVVTGAEVVRATWDDDEAAWTVEVADGRCWTASILVPATGQLSEPVVPDLPGVDQFRGPAFHTARWDHDVDLAGARVGLVGSGASAVQVGPAIVDEVDRLVVLQRSASWTIARPQAEFPARVRAWFRRLPVLGLVVRVAFWLFGEWRSRVMFRRDYPFRGSWERHVERRIARAVPDDPDLQRRLRPDHPMGCKRILVTDDWYPLFARDDVDLVDEPVARVSPDGVVTASGRQVDLDVIVWATGFDTLAFCRGIEIVGRDGRELHEAWDGEPSAHLGVTVPGFPNLFLVYGPNTNLGGNSIVFMIEQQMAHLQGAVEHLERVQADRVEVRPEVLAAFRDEMHDRHRRLVWGSCDSWYVDADGYSPTNWPGSVTEYRRRTATFDPADHVVATAGSRTG